MNKRWKRGAVVGGSVVLAWGVAVTLYDHAVIENNYEIKVSAARTPFFRRAS